MEMLKILKRPVISEKSFAHAENGKYVFVVSTESNKIEIKKAIEKLFKVTVLEVRTVVMKGKVKRVGRKFGKRSDFKKAYVTLKEGDKIEEFKGI
ncbi:MAG: 50S ribosomal protein L23 [bacterium]|nr:50S ribosomal protein L23 [bacterium]